MEGRTGAISERVSDTRPIGTHVGVYILGALWIPEREEMVQCPFHAFDPLSLSLLTAGEQLAGEPRPIRVLIEFQKAQVAQKDRDRRRNGPL